MMDCYMMRRSGFPTIIYDSFNRANGYLGNADSGQAWLTGGVATTTWVVGSNRAYALSALDNNFAYIDSARTDVIVSADITMGGFSYGSHLCARISSNNFDNMMSMYLAPTGNVAVRKTIAGVDTFLGTTTFSYTPGATYACVFTCKGNDFTVSINGVVKVSVTDDNALKTNTKVGMFLPLTTSAAFDYFDNFITKG